MGKSTICEACGLAFHRRRGLVRHPCAGRPIPRLMDIGFKTPQPPTDRVQDDSWQTEPLCSVGLPPAAEAPQPAPQAPSVTPPSSTTPILPWTPEPAGPVEAPPPSAAATPYVQLPSPAYEPASPSDYYTLPELVMDPPSGRETFWSKPRRDRRELIPSLDDRAEPALIGTEIHFAEVLEPGRQRRMCDCRRCVGHALQLAVEADRPAQPPAIAPHCSSLTRCRRRRHCWTPSPPSSTTSSRCCCHPPGWTFSSPVLTYSVFCFLCRCIDGNCRKSIWLKAASSNHQPGLIATYFVDSAHDIGGYPQHVRTDCATENNVMAAIECLVTNDASAYIHGTSPGKQRIKAWWSSFRKYRSQWWIKVFEKLVEFGAFHPECDKEVECL